eukprot:3783966-Prymnesium_polylepis.1
MWGGEFFLHGVKRRIPRDVVRHAAEEDARESEAARGGTCDRTVVHAVMAHRVLSQESLRSQ